MPLKTFQIPIAHHFISGSWREGSEILDVIDPSSGEKMTEIARGKAADIDRAVQAAQAALVGEWGQMTALDRGRILTKIGQKTLDHIDQLAQLEALDVGKPLSKRAPMPSRWPDI